MGIYAFGTVNKFLCQRWLGWYCGLVGFLLTAVCLIALTSVCLKIFADIIQYCCVQILEYCSQHPLFERDRGPGFCVCYFLVQLFFVGDPLIKVFQSGRVELLSWGLLLSLVLFLNNLIGLFLGPPQATDYISLSSHDDDNSNGSDCE